jgi:hypothetical protein
MAVQYVHKYLDVPIAIADDATARSVAPKETPATA